MKRIVTTIAATCLSLASIGAPALAADYDGGIISKSPSDGYTDVEFGSGWYLRGDLGYSVSSSTGVSFNRNTAGGDANASLSDDYSIGIGFGYTFNDFVRADVTYDIFSSRSWDGGASGCGVDGLGVAYTGDCASADSGIIEASNLGLNGYVNLGQFGGFSPYLGAGLGLAHVEYSGTDSVIACVVDPGESCEYGTHSGGSANPETFISTDSYAGGSSVNFSYALMAGVDYRIDRNWVADIGYKYTNITSEDVFASGGTATTVEFDGVEIHEVRAGLRYDLW